MTGVYEPLVEGQMTTLNVLVIGANRGIGLEILKSFKSRLWNVTGTIRPQTTNDPSFEHLRSTGAKILELDYLDEASIKKAAVDYGDESLDILVNVGGLPPSPKPWQEQTNEMMVEKFRVMAVGPFLAIKHFLPKLEKAKNPRVVNISSAFGSLTNTFGTCMAYRAAKSALNQNSVTLAREWEKEGRDVTIVCIEPGFLPTRLTGFNAEDDMKTCISGVTKVIDSITRDQNGAFFKWDGSTIPF
ncbi:hypothetical protein O1611_g807 [Lasiodiplodia mahajangana]|uniref:Uncharacterized protein n=1 Tax=Lasiodiplodia mahajangana TaxID=1108764 RepID=A0ACC2JZP2_9PEZI|nr:hypothetical protein O1611_g807 [Lasiodiplodia mahajangana]